VTGNTRKSNEVQSSDTGYAGTEDFRSTLIRRPFIQYGVDGVPQDIEYLSMPCERPEKPSLPSKPVAGSFQPKGNLLRRLLRGNQLPPESQRAFSRAITQWESDCQSIRQNYQRELEDWTKAAEAMDIENAQRYQQCLEDQQLWQMEKQQFDERRRQLQTANERFKQAGNYRNSDWHATSFTTH